MNIAFTEYKISAEFFIISFFSLPSAFRAEFCPDILGTTIGTGPGLVRLLCSTLRAEFAGNIGFPAGRAGPSLFRFRFLRSAFRAEF